MVVETETNPNADACAVFTLQSANLGRTQCSFVPNLGIDSNFNFVGFQRIGIILVELDSAIGKWTMGIEEKRAIGKWKLESGIGSVLWATRTTTRPMWEVGSVGMMWFMGMIRLVGMMRPMRMIRLMGMVGFVGMAGLVRMIGLVGMVGLTGVVGLARMAWLIGMLLWFVRVIRTVGGLGLIGTGGLAMAVRVPLARTFNLLRLGPLCVRVAFQFLIGIKASLQSLSAFRACCGSRKRTHRKFSGTVPGTASRSVKSENSMSCDLGTP